MNAESRVLMTILKYRRILIGELASLTSLPEDTVLEIIAGNKEFIKISGSEASVVNPVELALKLLSQGIEARRISELLNWRDFEFFTSRILSESQYEVEHSVSLTSPARFEIDVLGVDPSTGFSLAVDCKHWSITTPSRLKNAAENHNARVGKLVKYYPYVKSKYRILEKAKSITPLIITLLTPRVRVHANVLVISIRELLSFLQEKYTVLDYFEVKPLKIF
ncbi:MAG: hypothetical protein LM589_06650 [Thermosphaera sp.]|nr:hypothetical protein [Thermosphaera sp.]